MLPKAQTARRRLSHAHVYLSSVATRVELSTTCRDGRVCDSLSEALLWSYLHGLAAHGFSSFFPTPVHSISPPPTRHPSRNMGLEDIILDCNGRAKIIDFGMARAGHPVPPTGPCGRRRYMAPEVAMNAISNRAYDGFKVDVWACGIVLFM